MLGRFRLQGTTPSSRSATPSGAASGRRRSSCARAPVVGLPALACFSGSCHSAGVSPISSAVFRVSRSRITGPSSSTEPAAASDAAVPGQRGLPDRHELPPAIGDQHRQILCRASAPIGDLQRLRWLPAMRAQIGRAEPHRRDLPATRPAFELSAWSAVGVEPGGRGHKITCSVRLPVHFPGRKRHS